MKTEFILPNVDGKLVELGSYADKKALLIVFTCNHCPYAIAYEDRLGELFEKYFNQGIGLVAICSNNEVSHPQDSFENMKVRASEKGFKFPYLRDESQEIAKNYGAERTPHAFILLNSGTNFECVYSGAIDDNWESGADVKEHYVKDVLDKIIAGTEVPKQQTNPIGCSIKWKA